MSEDSSRHMGVRGAGAPSRGGRSRRLHLMLQQNRDGWEPLCGPCLWWHWETETPNCPVAAPIRKVIGKTDGNEVEV
jgi:hypothetical protein